MMLFPNVLYFITRQETSPSFSIDGGALLWGLLSGMVIVIGFFIVRYLNNNDRALHDLEGKVDRGFERFDERLDSFERNQIRIMVKLGVDED